MSTWFSFSLLLAAIILGITNSKRTLRLYFVSQLIATLAEYFGQFTKHYTLIYVACVVLVVETSVFLLIDAGVNRLTWRSAATYAAFMTAFGMVGLYELSSFEEWYLIGEGCLLAALGMAFLLRKAQERTLRAIGTLTLGMAVYDFLWLLLPKVRDTNNWAPSLMCTLAFLWIAIGGDHARLRPENRQTV